MTTAQGLLTVAAIALGTMLTRFLPFWLFPKGKPMPPLAAYLSRVLPCAVMGLLVVYCLKDISYTSAPFGIPAILAVLLVTILHLWKKNTLISIVSGTACYMLLIHLFG